MNTTPAYPLHFSLLNNICKGWQREVRFHPVRKWLFDFAHHKLKVGIEIEGGIFARSKSRHTTGAGYKKDMEKYNEAAMLGWQVLRYMPEQTGEMVRDIERIVEDRGLGPR